MSQAAGQTRLACAPSRVATPCAVTSTRAHAHARRQQGLASYYADAFAGRRTASGEPYDPRALTAAHRTLPFGAIVDVVRTDGRAVRVRVNDRGPYAEGRIIDLSRAAAVRLGMLRAGVVPVTLYLVWAPPR